MNAPFPVPVDEVTVHHQYHKTDQNGNKGSDNNIKCCTDQQKFCISSHVNKLQAIWPGWLDSTRDDHYLLELSDGKVLSKTVVIRMLRESALRLGLDPADLATHSLRAGGCSAMHDAKLPAHVIQRRGRWISDCWRLYCWQSRSRDDGLANAMAGATSELLTHLH